MESLTKNLSHNQDHQLQSLSSSSSNLGHLPIIPQTALHHYYEADTIKLSGLNHPDLKINHHLNSYNSFNLNPISWYTSSNQTGLDRSSLTSPPPFSNLINHQPIPNLNLHSDFSSTDPIHLQRGWSFPRRSFSNRKRKSHITLHQHVTSEISLTPKSSRLSTSSFFRHHNLSEVVISHEKFNPKRFSLKRSNPPSVHHRLSISSPIPESFIHFQLPSANECPIDQTSINLNSSTYQPHDRLTTHSNEISSHDFMMPNSNLHIDDQIQLPNLNEKSSSTLLKVWSRLKNKAKCFPKLNRPKHSHLLK